MKTELAAALRETPAGREADAILRSCVHCGFCLATCPTYQLLGDELDSPRGRIYLIKQALEGAPIGRATQLHLDRCLTCRACETTCPSGVRYGTLVEIGRGFVESQIARPWRERLMRRALRFVLPEPRRFAWAYRGARMLRVLLPARLRRQLKREPLPPPIDPGPAKRGMILLEGCVQPALAPEINAAARNVFARLGIRLDAAPSAGCCGALDHHLNAEATALERMRRNIDAWLPLLERGAEAIVISASGCGVEIKDYGRLLSHDPAYAEGAQRISAAALDLSEALAREEAALAKLLAAAPAKPAERIAFQAPCTLQHGQRIIGKVEALLAQAGYSPAFVPDAHLCCGSAGTYSLLHPEIAGHLRDQKLIALQSDQPSLVATANIGCLTHLRGGAAIPVVHWITLIEARLAAV